MTELLERAFAEANKLAPAEQDLLASRMLVELGETRGTTASEANDAWLDEIKRRDAQIVAGTVQCVPAEDVMRRARERVQ